MCVSVWGGAWLWWKTHLNQVLALGLGDEWLQFRRGESIDQASLGDDQEQNLGTSQDGEFICLEEGSVYIHVDGCGACAMNALMPPATHLLHDAGLALGKGNVSTRLVLDELDLNLATLTAGLVVVVVVIVGGGGLALALDAAGLGVAVVELLFVVVGWVLVGDLSRHDGQ